MAKEIQDKLKDAFEKARIESQGKVDREKYILKTFLQYINYKEDFNEFALKYSYCVLKLCKSSYGSTCPIKADCKDSCEECCKKGYMYEELLKKTLKLN